MRGPCWIVCSLFLLLPCATQAQPAGSFLGKRVVTREGTVLRSGKDPVDDENRERTSKGTERRDSRVYRVQQTNGDQVFLLSESDGARGWVAARQVMTLDQAIAAYTKTIAANPRDSFALVDRGTVLASLGKIDEAILDYTKAIEVQPNNEVAFLNRGNLFLVLREPQQAIADYTKAIEVDPAYVPAYLNRGRAAMMMPDYEQAVADFSKVIELDPKGSSGPLFRGAARLLQRSYDEALGDLTKAIELDPKAALAHYNRGLVQMAKADPTSALADFTETIKLDPRNVDAWVQRGTARRSLLDYAEAVADFDEALRLRPNDPHVLNNRGNARACLQDFPGAVADFDAALKVDQSYTAALYNRAVVDLITGEARAIETGKRLANLERRAPVLAPYALVVSHLAARQVGRVKEAKEALDLATRLVPGDLWPSPVLKFLRGELKADALLAAAKDNDQRTVAHGVLGYDALLKNNKEGARDHFTWVVEQGNRGFAQFIMARAELAKLEKR